MKHILQYNIFEKKMWNKTTKEMISYVESLYSKQWIFIDTETTGLLGPKQDQLTQISAIIKDPKTLKTIDTFNQKIKLTDEIKTKLDDDVKPGWNRRNVLSFNHYGDKIKGKQYLEEQEVLNMFEEWINNISNPLFIIQNAEFDMNMLNGRKNERLKRIEVLDTKDFLQLYIIPIYQKLAESDNYYKEKLGKIGKSQRDNGLISSSMSKWAPEFNINTSGYHDALFDCEMMFNMFINILNIMKDNKDLDISKYQEERINILKTH